MNSIVLVLAALILFVQVFQRIQHVHPGVKKSPYRGQQILWPQHGDFTPGKQTSAANDEPNDGTPDINGPHPPNNVPSGPQSRSIQQNATSDSTEPGVLLGRIGLICIIGGDQSCLDACANKGGSTGICDLDGLCLCYV